MNSRVLGYTAIFCQLLSLFPFVILTEGLGLGEYVWWHYIALFAVFAVFFASGYGCGSWAAGGNFSRKAKPWAVFASRAAVVVPTAAFIIVCAAAGLSAALYLYALPAAIIAYFGGHHSCGLEYSDVFSRGWFALYFVAAIISSGLLWFTHNEDLSSAGVFQLCLVFGALIVLAAVLANQTNIDSRTRQRSSGKAVLPRGLRGYNAGLIAGVCIVTVGLFLFAKPLAGLINSAITALLRLLLSLVRNNVREDAESDYISDADSEAIDFQETDNSFAEILSVLLFAAVVVLVIRFRKQIWQFIKELFAPLFKESSRDEELPFTDEISDSVQKQDAVRSRRRTEQQLLRRFRRETDAAKKFRIGYAVFLIRLSRTPFAQLPSDTTTVHGKKGVCAFRSENISHMVRVYNDVRYGERAPTEEELEMQSRLIEEMR